MNPRDKLLEKAQMRVLFSVPFFAAGVARLPIIWDESVGTACTNGKIIRWNPVWFDELTKENPQYHVTVECEEVGHCLLGHLWRKPPEADPQTWNMACDQALRLMMKEYGEIVKSNKLADPFPFPAGSEPDSKYSGMSEEEIYASMTRSQQKNEQSKDGAATPSPGRGKAGNAKSNKGSQPPPNAAGSPPSPKFAEFECESGSQADGKEAGKEKSRWEGVLIQSAAAHKGYGNLPGSLSRFITDMVTPTVPWWEIIRNWLREQVNDDWNWMKPNQYYGESPFMMPSLESERIGEIVFATDTSGSCIDPKILAQFIAEKQNCLDEMKPFKLLDLCCDTRITSRKEYRPGDTIDGECPGGGGTDFRPVFEELANRHQPPKCLVYLTDLQGTFPDEEPPYPVIWVTWQAGKSPFGQVVEI